MRILAISGSLRAASSNTAILEAAARLAPADVTISMFRDLAALPHFNPDLDVPDATGLPPAVSEFRRLVGEADALLLSTPEYAHGLPGVFKNALDWLVGSTEFPGKCVAIFAPTSRSVYALAQLREVLATMSARVIDRDSFIIPLPSREVTAADIVEHGVLSVAIRSATAELASVDCHAEVAGLFREETFRRGRLFSSVEANHRNVVSPNRIPSRHSRNDS